MPDFSSNRTGVLHLAFIINDIELLPSLCPLFAVNITKQVLKFYISILTQLVLDDVKLRQCTAILASEDNFSLALCVCTSK